MYTYVSFTWLYFGPHEFGENMGLNIQRHGKPCENVGYQLWFLCLLYRLSLPCAINIVSSGYAITAHKSGYVDQVIIHLIH